LPDPAPLPNDTRQNKEEEAADPMMVGQEEKEGQSGRGQPSAEEHDRARTFKQVLDPYESSLRRQRKNIEQREAAKNTQLRERRGHTIDPFSDLCAGLGNDFAIHQEQEDLSSKCVEEAGEFIDELADQIKLDFSTFARHSYEDDNGSIDSDL
jgi:hypothetical protein